MWGIESTPPSFHRVMAEVTLEADRTGLQVLHQGNLLAIFSLNRLRGLSAGQNGFHWASTEKCYAWQPEKILQLSSIYPFKKMPDF